MPAAFAWIRAEPHGIHVAPADVWIDPSRPVARALVTHGHADHARAGHGATIATPATLAIMELRYATSAGATPVEYGETVRLPGEVEATFVPAGHVLGSAQIVLEHAGERVIVTGDYKRRADPTCPPFAVTPCDVLITEATFGLPVFCHPPVAAEIAKLLKALRDHPDRCVLVGAYALGKAQRLIAELRAAGHREPIYLHGAMERMCRLYEEFGVDLGELRLVADHAKDDLRGSIVICPPGALNDRWSRRLPDPITAMASGWMRVRQRARQRNVELPLVISDHADWGELTRTIEDVDPAETWITHGREEALLRWCQLHQRRARALALVGYEDEDVCGRNDPPPPGVVAARRADGGGLRTSPPQPPPSAAVALPRWGRIKMEQFAALVDALVYTRSRNEKLRLIAEYLKQTPDPDRGWALAALTGGLSFPAVKASTIRNLMTERVDPVLWVLSRDFVGDTAETASLLWPEPEGDVMPPPSVSEAVETLGQMTRMTVMSELPRLLDRLDPAGRYALFKLATGGMRIGVSARLAKTAFAQAFVVAVEDVEEYWHGLQPPYAPLFAWAADGAPPPHNEDLPLFRPFMLAHPLDDAVVDLEDYVAEWKWDGIRVQLVHAGGETRLYSRTGDDISGSFPEMADALTFPAVLDGELLVRGSHQGGEAGGAASFNALQQRLGRKAVSARMLAEYPAFVRLYDVLIVEGEDLRELPWTERRARLEALTPLLPADRFDLSPVVEAEHFEHLAAIRSNARDEAIEGLMLKRRDSPYVAGRKTGLWYKWKRDPLLVDTVLMYAQRGNGKRSSFYSDYTFGCWDGDPDQGAELLPVGKAYFGFTDEQLKELDRYVRNHTVNRFGPVRETDRSLVFEVAFDSVHASKRHKSGLAMRFPRISRIRWDKPAEEADRIEALRALVRD